ncbi:MAG: CocE/NonD family hydrolase [Asticcacaulis sp.]
MKTRTALLTAVAMVFAAPVFAQTAAVSAPYQATASYNGYQTESVYIDSYDGTRLAVTIRRPSLNGVVATTPLPVIVTQDRTGEAEERRKPAIDYFTSHGYVWVSQDRRGTGASFGLQTGFVNQADALDAKAVIEWAAVQDFSNRKVVAYGCSNQAAWQYLVAAHDPEHLVAMAPACASPQFFDHGMSMNGIPLYPASATGYTGECKRPAGGARPGGTAPPPVQPVDADTDGALLNITQTNQRCGSGPFGQYWLNMTRDAVHPYLNYQPALTDTVINRHEKVKAAGIPMLQIGGWFDAGVEGQFTGYRLWGGRIIQGPWTHGNRAVPDTNYPAATIDLNAETLRWYDHYAKGVDNGADKAGILYYTFNAPAGTEWRETAVWPLPNTQATTYYLNDKGLSVRAPSKSGKPATYTHDASVSWFDGKYAPLAHGWAGDMRASDAKSLVHTLSPLGKDTQMTGTPVAKLWVSADVEDINVFAVLEDVAPDGRSTYVTDGRLRASWRQLHTPAWGGQENWHRGYSEDLVKLKAGEPVEMVFDFFPISYVFKAGHSPRVSIVTHIGQDYQQPDAVKQAAKPPVLTVYRDAQHPSAVILPLVQE